MTIPVKAQVVPAVHADREVLVFRPRADVEHRRAWSASLGLEHPETVTIQTVAAEASTGTIQTKLMNAGSATPCRVEFTAVARGGYPADLPDGEIRLSVTFTNGETVRLCVDAVTIGGNTPGG